MKLKTLQRLQKAHKEAIIQLLQREYQQELELTDVLKGAITGEGIPPYFLFYEKDVLVGLFVLQYVDPEVAEGKLFAGSQTNEAAKALKDEVRDWGVPMISLINQEEALRPVADEIVFDYAEYIMKRSKTTLLPERKDRKLDLTLRPFTQKDQIFYRYLLSNVFEMEPQACKERINSVLTEETMQAFVLENKERELLGMCAVYQGESSTTLFDIAITPNYQGNGYGTEMFYQLLKFLEPLNRNQILQVSSKSVPAVKMYHRFGFEIAERQEYSYIKIS